MPPSARVPGLRRIAWGGTLLLVAPLFWVLSPFPLAAGFLLVAVGAARASHRVEAFRTASRAAVVAMPSMAGYVLLLMDEPDLFLVDLLFLTAMGALATLCAATGEGHARLDDRFRGVASRIFGWMAATGWLALAGLLLLDAHGRMPYEWEDVSYGVVALFLLTGWVGSVASWHACARMAKGEGEEVHAAGPLPALPDAE